MTDPEGAGSAPASDAERDSPMEYGALVAGRYRIQEVIGEGGFAVVYRASQEIPVKREVALKVIKLGMDTRQVVARFEAERQALAIMDHPNIARVLDGGVDPSGRPFFVMELVAGIPITDYCNKHRLSTEERLGLFVEVCQAVQHAHQKGIIHRDLKPSNVLVSLPEDSGSDADTQPEIRSGVPKVIDFGIAKATQVDLSELTIYTRPHQFVGTPAYMSPEQLEESAEDVDTRSDVYALGVLLYQLLTGRMPFERKNSSQGDLDRLRQAIRQKDPARPSTRLSTLDNEELTQLAARHRTDPSKFARRIRGDLDWIVMKCLEKDRARRYETANGLALEIKRHLDSEPIIARPPSVGYRARKFIQRNRLAVAGTATLLVLLVVGTVVASIGFFQANKQRQIADLRAQDLRVTSYGANLRGATFFNETVGNGGRAVEALEQCPPEMRDWEWRFVRATADQTHHVIASGLEDLEFAVLSPDGNTVLSARDSGLYQLWDFATGQELRAFRMGGADWAKPRFSPDGQRLALSDAEQIVIWDTKSGERLKSYRGSRPIAVHVGSNSLLGVHRRDGTPELVIWDHLSDRSRTRSGFPRKRPIAAAFAPDGKQVALFSGTGTFGDGDVSIDLWDTTSGEFLQTLRSGHYFPVTDIEFNLDRQLIATSSYDEFAKVFAPLESEEPVRSFQAMGLGMLSAVTLSRDGRRLVAGGSHTDILMWDLTSTDDEQEPEVFKGHGSRILSLDISADGGWIVSASQDGTIRAWDSEPSPSQPFLLVNRFADNLAFSPDGTELVTVHGTVGTGFRGPFDRSESPALRWDVRTGALLGQIGGPDLAAQTATYSPDGSKLAILGRKSGHGGDRQAMIFDTSTWEQLVSLEQKPGLLDVRFAGKHLVGYGLAENTAYAWDPSDGSILGQVSFGDSNMLPSATAWSADGTLLAACLRGFPGEVRILDVLTGQLRQTLRGVQSTVSDLQFDGTNNRLAAATSDTSALIWDLETGRLTHRLRGHSERVTCLTFSPSGQRLVTGGEDDRVKIWKLEQDGAEELMSLGPHREAGNILRIRYSPDGEVIAVVPQFGPPWFYDAALRDRAIRKARNRIRREIGDPFAGYEALKNREGD